MALTCNRTKRRLLLVDQNLSDLRNYSRILELGGFDVRGLASCEEGAACLLRESFDLVVVCQVGPEFTARPVVTQATQTDPRVPVLVLSQYISWDCVLQALRLGAAGFHRKTLTPSKLAELAMKAVQPRSFETEVAS